MINFKANYINTAQIKTYNMQNNTYQQNDVSFVEVDIKNSKDVNVINQVVKLWQDNSFANNIAYDINNIDKDDAKKEPFRVFALTSQTEGVENLDSNQVLALAKIEKTPDNNIFLEYLQVDPNIVYATGIPLIKHCGTAVLNGLKQLFRDRSIFLNSRLEKFYTKSGFIKIGQNQYFWNKFIK